jgi:hypothetical protein
VSLVYLDQWLRGHPEQHQTLAALYETLRAADTILKTKGQDATLAASLSDWADTSELSGATALQDSLRAISRRLSVGPPTRLISQAAPQET